MINVRFFDGFLNEEVVLLLASVGSIRGKLMLVGSEWLTMSTSSSSKQHVKIDDITSIHCKKDAPESNRVFCEF